MAKGGKGGSTTDYGQSLAEFKNGTFATWSQSCITLKKDCGNIPVYSNAANVKGNTLKDFIDDAAAKANDLSKRLDKLDNPSTFTVPPSLSVKVFDGSVTGVSCSFTGSSFALKWLEFSFCGFFFSMSGVSAMNVISDFKYKTAGGAWDGFKTIVSAGLFRSELDDGNVAALKDEAAGKVSRHAPCKSEMGTLMHF